MEEILFRGKCISNNKWLYGNLLRTDDGIFIIQNHIPYHRLKKYEVDSETVGQYTGLTDRNERKIFEGDIVTREDRRSRLYLFREQPIMKCRVVWSDKYGFETSPSCGFFDKKAGLECEIIGNIFDTPKLIET